MASLEDLEKNIGETTKLYEDYVTLVKTKIKSLEEQLKVFTQDKDKIASSEQQLAAKVKELEGNVEAVSQEKATYFARVTELEAELAELKSSSGVTGAELTTAKSALEEANKKVSDKDVELSKITGDLGAVNKELADLTTEKEVIDKNINAINDQLNALKKRIQEEKASLSEPAGTESAVVAPEVTGQGTEGTEEPANKRERSNLEKQGMLPLSNDQINAYNTTQRQDEKANLEKKMLNRIAVLSAKGSANLVGDEADEYKKLQAALNMQVQAPETVPEQVSNIQGGKTRKNGTKKSKTYKRTKNGKNGKNGKKSKTQKRVKNGKNGTKNGTKKSNRKTRK